MSSPVTDDSQANAQALVNENPSAAATALETLCPDDARRQRTATTKSAHATTLANAFGWAGSHPFTILFGILFAGFGVFAVSRHSTEWDEVYLASARVLLGGKNLYREVKVYTYPPFSAWVSIPFAFMPLRVARTLWFGVCAASLAYLIKSSWRLAGGPRLEPGRGAPAVPNLEIVASMIGQVIALQFALNSLTHLQLDVPIAAMLMAGCAALGAGRFMRGATWIGVAAAFKATPLLFAPYLLWRKQWRAAGWLAVVAIAANLLPNTVHSPPGGGLWLTRWYSQYLKPMGDAKYRPGDWKNQRDNNQAVAGAINRWMATTWDVRNNEFELIDRADQPNPLLMKAAFGGCCLALLLPIAWAQWERRRRRRLPHSEAADGGAVFSGAPTGVRGEENARPPEVPSAVIIECGIVLLLMVLFSPNSSRAHFCIMYLPAFCMARLALRPGAGSLLIGLLALSAICSTLSIHVRLPGSQVPEQLMLWVGVVMLSAFFLLLACCRALGRYPAGD